MSEEKELIKKSIFMFLTNGIGKLFLVIANVLMARLLGAEIYGEFIYILSIITIITIFPMLGVDQGHLKVIPQNELNNNLELNKSIGTFSLVVTFIGSILIVILLYIWRKDFSVYILGDIKYKSTFLNQIGLIVLITILFTLASLFQARRMMKEYSLVMNIFQEGIFCISILFLYFINIDYNLVPVISKHLALIVALLYLFYRAYNERILGNIRWEYKGDYQELIKYSFTLMIVGSLGIIINKINIYMVGYYLDAKSVGIFQSATQIGIVASFMLGSINQVFTPMISKLYMGNEIVKLNNIYGKINYFMLITSVIILSFLVLFKKDIMQVFGTEFIAGSNALLLIAVGQLFNAISGPCGFILSMTGYAKFNMYINIVMLILIITLNMKLLPLYGINGAATSSAISIILINSLRMVVLYKKLGIIPFRVINTH